MELLILTLVALLFIPFMMIPPVEPNESLKNKVVDAKAEQRTRGSKEIDEQRSKDHLNYLADKQLKEKLAKESEEMLKHSNDIRDAENTTILTLIESTDVVKQVLANVNRETLAEYIDLLKGSGETSNLITDYNEDLRTQYEEKVRTIISRKIKKHPDIVEAHVQADVSKCMDLSLNNLMRTYGGTSLSIGDTVTKTEIKKTHSWDDLKDKF